MSLLNYLQFQKIDPSLDDTMPESHKEQDSIAIEEPFNEGDLESFWEKVVDDIHNDPDWFSFADE